MKYSYSWIQKHIEEKLPEPETLREIIHSHAFEVESANPVKDDTIFDIAVLPDRAGDCLSHYGMAREVAGLLGLTLKKERTSELPEVALALPVEIKSEVCRRYIAVAIDGVKVGPSPEWLKAALESIGQRSINNIVDATNYVLNDLGQPTHAFDATKIDGGITIRTAHEGETIITLSDEEKKLSPEMCVIADYLGAIAIAGVKGGKTAEVDETTTRVIFEIANFDPISVRKTSRSLNLITDASKRFENNLSPEHAHIAAQALVALITEIAGGEVVGVKDLYPTAQETRTIPFTVGDIARILGSQVTKESIEKVFDAYSYSYTNTDGVYTLTVPVYRQDIVNIADVAEEIGRVSGYEHIQEKTLPFTPAALPHDVFEMIRAVRAYLVGKGFSEVMNYTFVKKGDIFVARGPKDKSALRTNLSDSLKESFEKNRLNAPLLDLSAVKIFEIGTVFYTEGNTLQEQIRVATMENGTLQELPLHDFAKANALSAVSPVDYAPLTVERPFVPWSVYPFIVRDVAVWVSNGATQTLASIVATFAEKYCVKPAFKFDEFSKDGKTSVAYRFVFQSNTKTLTEEEVGIWWNQLTAAIEKEKDFEIR